MILNTWILHAIGNSVVAYRTTFWNVPTKLKPSPPLIVCFPVSDYLKYGKTFSFANIIQFSMDNLFANLFYI